MLDGSANEVRIAADTLMALIGALLDGVRHATRFAVEGRSTRSGPRPAWLDAACRLEVTGLSAGSTVLELEAPVLEEVAPERFPGHLGGRPDSASARVTSVDLFAKVLNSALNGNVEQLDADRALLESCVRFGQIARDAGGDLRLEGLSLAQEKILLNRTDLSKLELLRDQTPPPRAARVAAQLETISANRAEVTLIVDGQSIPAHLEEHDREKLLSLFGKQVVVSGMARFRPSGRLLMIDAEYLAEARDADALFSKVPDGRPPSNLQLKVAQSQSAGVVSFFGSWPGEESDSELLASLEALG